MITLNLTGDVNQAWAILEDYAGCYGDNGGEPDGNAWLPSDGVRDDLAAQVVAAGLGKLVKARAMNDRELAGFLGGGRILEDGWEDDETVFDAWQMQLNERQGGWAHYGAYGVSDSLWIVEV